MARVCQVTGKGVRSGNNVSHANNKTRRRWLPNLHERKFWVPSEKRWIKLRLSNHALRTIDTWYEEADANGPIAAEPYGSVTTQGKAYRHPGKRQDFYNLLDGWIIKDKVPAPEQQHFVVATLIRGGVFGDAS